MCNKPYVAFSGGKDSLAILCLLKEINATDILVFTQGDDLDFPFKEEVCRKIISELGFTNYHYQLSRKSAMQQIASSLDTEVRGTFSHVVESFINKHKPDGVIMGLRNEESAGRRINFKLHKHKHIYPAADGLKRCIPIATWSGVDVFSLIIQSKSCYMPVYDCDYEKTPPHELRFSWMLNPQFINQSTVTFLKRNYFQQYQKLLKLNPQIAAYA